MLITIQLLLMMSLNKSNIICSVNGPFYTLFNSFNTFENVIAVLRLDTFVSIQKYKMIFYIIDSDIHNAAYLCFGIKILIYQITING